MANPTTVALANGRQPSPPNARMSPIRTAARALIVRDGQLLTVAMENQYGPFFVLPGGGQQSGETLAATVRRECMEEIGCAVRVGPLLYIREYIGRNHQFSEAHRHFHQLESVFLCELEGSCAKRFGTERDRHQVGIQWLPIAQLDRFPLFPETLKSLFQNGEIVIPQVYLGDIN